MLVNNREFNEISYKEARKHFGYVYVTRNDINGMCYVGISYKKSSTRSYLGSGNYLKKAIKKYGKGHFTRYIIDVAETKYYLEHLEVLYIKYYFGENCVKSKQWYNITDGLQRGGNHWAGLSEADRNSRIQALSAINKGRKRTMEQRQAMSEDHKKWFQEHPEERAKIARTTKLGMQNLEVKKKLHKHKNLYRTRKIYPDGTYRLLMEDGNGKSHWSKKKSSNRKFTKEERRHILSVAQKKRFESANPWNKGKSMTDQQTRGLKSYNFKVYIVKLGNDTYHVGCHSNVELAEWTKQHLPCGGLGKHTIAKIINSHKPYSAKIASKKALQGITIKKREVPLD
ncbi:hypothetical protein GPK34_00585 [Secundilactobacillus kimchicus]|uniref:hypothetical protein n=1 Tax=Secundilactobacillus kimchicus TaxID=528209 RepID=UPI001C01AE6F|nr:hypothetical protein [Secundilactobacillus kimchicus]MBT9670534.1 hypothetical protein [Secundilactobacillus kimchicus]